LPTHLLDLIQASGSFVLTGHENPDGDCIGAQIALYHLLKALGKEVWIVNPDPLPRSFDFLAEATPFGHARTEDAMPKAEVLMLLDCCQLSRTGAVAREAEQHSMRIAVIDHHVGSDHGDGDVCYVDSTAAATGVLVRRLYRAFSVPVSRVAAEGVFLSLVSDTGWFRYSNTDHEVLSMAAELLGLGVDSSRLYDQLHRRMHPDSVAMLAECLQRHRLLCDGRLSLMVLDRWAMERANRIDFDTDLLIDPMRSVDGVEVVALLKERFDGAVKLSLRAKGDIDVQRVAATFGGGGHKKASGASVPGSVSEAMEAVVAAVAVALAEGGDCKGDDR
jgi:phosphoesterase RecJ-like protein